MTGASVGKMADFNRAYLERRAELLVKQSRIVSPNETDFQHEKQPIRGSDNLFQAITKGNVNEVRQLLKYGASLDSKHVRSFGPLVAALHVKDSKKRSRMFKMLVKMGASYTDRDDRNQRSVMHWVCALGRTEQVASLMEETAGDINLLEKDKDGLTALHHCVIGGSLETVEVLLEFHVRFGVSVDVSDNLGQTPYIYARRLGYKDIARVLRNKGMACEEHADNLFRSPRVWSTIGRTERKKVLSIYNHEQIATAKIFGKLSATKQLASSSNVGSEVVIDSSGSNTTQQRVNSSNCTAKSITCSEEAFNGDGTLLSLSTEARLHSNVELIACDANFSSCLTADSVKDNRYRNSKSDIKASYQIEQLSTESIKTRLPKSNFLTSKTTPINTINHNQTLPVLNQRSRTRDSMSNEKHGVVKGSRQQMSARPNTSTFNITSAPVTSNIAALSLIKQAFPKGRSVIGFHSSVIDKSKADEYRYLLDNLNNLMAAFSEQNTESFRKSVKLPKPEPPRSPTVSKNQSKISSWAILFGNKDRTRRKAIPIRGSLAKKKDGRESGRRREKPTKGDIQCTQLSAKNNSN